MTRPHERALAGSPMTLVDCGCLAYVYADESGIEIEYCPLHESAPDLLEACERLIFVLEDDSSYALEHLALDQAREAIGKAKGIDHAER